MIEDHVLIREILKVFLMEMHEVQLEHSSVKILLDALDSPARMNEIMIFRCPLIVNRGAEVKHTTELIYLTDPDTISKYPGILRERRRNFIIKYAGFELLRQSMKSILNNESVDTGNWSIESDPDLFKRTNLIKRVKLSKEETEEFERFFSEMSRKKDVFTLKEVIPDIRSKNGAFQICNQF